jgi:NTP pyrophosphatase (non-canonical NTP hydrolase)
MVNIDDQTREALLITQEECAEVTQAISKVFRFGFDTRYPDMESPTNKEKMEEEIGDLLAMIDILVEKCIISDNNINQARKQKKNKLKRWSNINT